MIKVYMTSVPSNNAVRKKQQHIFDILTARKVLFEQIDITAPTNEEEKKFMREHAKCSPNTKVPLPPQIFSGEKYIGDYDQFYEAVEEDDIDVFLGLATKTEVSQAQVEVTGGKD